MDSHFLPGQSGPLPGQKRDIGVFRRVSLPTKIGVLLPTKGPFLGRCPTFLSHCPTFGPLINVDFSLQFQGKVPAVPFGPLIFLLS
nr:MAG TPA: hypothetical protein [Caudoviricetes sp.]